uniref:NADH dehydrogenase subunit 5 n=1 Tax=Neocrepidodera transversa TaxID=877844 RepID=A0A1P8NM02_9CUCU|nr:NADH dehydrogenase subunit 5 [Neocrepidodera transversa]
MILMELIMWYLTLMIYKITYYI